MPCGLVLPAARAKVAAAAWLPGGATARRRCTGTPLSVPLSTIQMLTDVGRIDRHARSGLELAEVDGPTA